MKKKFKFFKVSNINNPYKYRYKRRYSFFGIHFTVKNKEKIKFYIEKTGKKISKYYNQYISEINEADTKRVNKNPLLTIILLTYNHQDTIEDCILSLVNQKTKYPYLIKIFDDASTDKTSEICFEYMKKYPEKIQYVLEKENTYSKCFSKAIKSLKSKYWCFIDGDDKYLTDDKIEEALDFMETHSDYITFANDFLFQTKTKKASHTHVAAINKLEKGNQDISLDNYAYLHPSSRIHRRVIEDYDKEYPGLKVISDYYLYFLHLIKGKCYFSDTIKSVWNFNSQGMYSKKSLLLREYSDRIIDYNLNSLLNYKYNDFFVKKWKIKKHRIMAQSRLPKQILGIAWAVYMRNKRIRLARAEKKVIDDSYNHIKKIKQFRYLKNDLF